MLRLGGIVAAGAAGAAIVTALDASSAAAGVDGDVVLDADNAGSGSSRTAVVSTYADREVFAGINDAATGTGLRGRAGSDAGTDYEDTWRDQPVGAFGESGESSGYGVVGDAPSGTGVHGTGGTGVHGVAATTGVGVQGNSASGEGVRGISTNSDGVRGDSTSSYGIHGASQSSHGVREIGRAHV